MNSQHLIALLSTARGLGLTSYPHLQAILHLGRVETCRTMDLTTVCHCVPEAVTQVVDKLIKLGLVSRRYCEKDRRVIHLDLTPSGKDTYETIIAASTEPIRSPKPAPKRKAGRPLKSGLVAYSSPSHPVG